MNYLFVLSRDSSLTPTVLSGLAKLFQKKFVVPSVEQLRLLTASPEINRNKTVFVIDYDALSPKEVDEVLELIDQSLQSCFWLSDRPLRHSIRALYNFPGINHIFGRNNPNLTRDLKATGQKILEGKGTGIDSHFQKPSKKLGTHIKSSDDFADFKELAIDWLVDMKASKDMRDRILSTLEELSMNALYNAPSDPSRIKRYFKQKDRGEPITLKESIEIKLVSDSLRFGVEVSDPFGSLERREVTKNLYRCLRRDEHQVKLDKGGTGIGLYMCLNDATQLSFVVKPGTSTHVLALFEKTKSRKKLDEMSRSISFLTV